MISVSGPPPSEIIASVGLVKVLYGMCRFSIRNTLLSMCKRNKSRKVVLSNQSGLKSWGLPDPIRPLSIIFFQKAVSNFEYMGRLLCIY